MRVLISNDDGILSPGLIALKEELQEEHEIWVTAPDRERSGTSHSITLRGPVRFRQVAERMFACNGTPADTVLYALLGAIPVKPDLIVSGINRGPNLGTDIIYSGTAAAARQGALVGIPSIAVSVAPVEPPFPYREAAGFLRRNLEILLGLWSSDHFININFPVSTGGSYKVDITHPSRRIYSDRADEYVHPNGDRYYFLTGEGIHAREEKGSDWNAIRDGNISISPVYLHPMNQDETHMYENAHFRMDDHE